MAKLQPAVMTLNFSGDGYIDLSQAASLANRRFYRQGLNWAVSGFTVNFSASVPVAGNVRIETLPTTWVSSNAWHKSFAMWLKQQNEAIEQYGAESTVAKFGDFKIFMDTVHVSAGFGANLLPTYGDGSGTFTLVNGKPVKLSFLTTLLILLILLFQPLNISCIWLVLILDRVLFLVV